MNIIFHCNLDDVKRDISELNQRCTFNRSPNLPIPRKGESVRFSFFKNARQYSYDLAVVDVAYDYGSGSVIVELHMPALYSGWSTERWSDWFKSHRYG